MKNLILFFLFLFSVIAYNQKPDNESIDEAAAGLKKLTLFHNRVKNIHPYLYDLRPVAVIKGDSLLLFDADPIKNEYRFIKTAAAPFPMNEQIRASFPFGGYDNKPVCFTGAAAFNTTEGMAVILHEFVHCSQYTTVEAELKGQLELYKTSMDKQDYSWELTHPFTYDSLFLSNYKLFHEALKADDTLAAEKYRESIKHMLSKADYEYMVWQEWKEGFARYLENQVRVTAGAKENNGGSSYPNDRVVFYYGGSVLISYLIKNNPDLKYDTKQLFKTMFRFPG